MNSFSCSPLNTTFSYSKKASRSSWIRRDVTWHYEVTLTWLVFWCVAVWFLSFPMGWYRVSEMEFSHMGKISIIWCARILYQSIWKGKSYKVQKVYLRGITQRATILACENVLTWYISLPNIIKIPWRVSAMDCTRFPLNSSCKEDN